MDAEEVKSYYDKYTTRQVHVGVNDRHRSILEKSVYNGMLATDRVLEIGCGVGTYTSLLMEYVTEGEVLAVDLSPKSVAIAQQNLGQYKNLSIKACDIISEEIKGSFDTIVLPDVIEHIPLELHHSLFGKLSQLLEDQGNLFVHIPDPYYLQWCHEHKPEILQIIDQPIYTDELIANAYPHNLYLHRLETYDIWVEQGEYQFIVLKKNVKKDYKKIDRKVSFNDKVKFKLKKILGQ